MRFPLTGDAASLVYAPPAHRSLYFRRAQAAAKMLQNILPAEDTLTLAGRKVIHHQARVLMTEDLNLLLQRYLRHMAQSIFVRCTPCQNDETDADTAENRGNRRVSPEILFRTLGIEVANAVTKRDF